MGNCVKLKYFLIPGMVRHQIGSMAERARPWWEPGIALIVAIETLNMVSFLYLNLFNLYNHEQLTYHAANYPAAYSFHEMNYLNEVCTFIELCSRELNFYSVCSKHI